jgi:serine protease Do
VEVPQIWNKRDEAKRQQLKFYPVPLPSPLDFGLAVDALTPQLATFFKVPGGQGLLVTSVLEGSLASESGFRAGDVVIRVNGVEPKSPRDLKGMLDSSEVGALTIRFVRDGKTLSRKLVLP